MEKQDYEEISVENDCEVYCWRCNKVIHLKEGEIIPICCGLTMKIID